MRKLFTTSLCTLGFMCAFAQQRRHIQRIIWQQWYSYRQQHFTPIHIGNNDSVGRWQDCHRWLL